MVNFQTAHNTQSITCTRCGISNPPSALLCDACGTILATDLTSTQTMSLQGIAQAVRTGTIDNFRRSGVFPEGSILYISVERENQPFVRSVYANPLIFGRGDGTEIVPDIDLDPFNGHNKGVSRKHASIRHYQSQLLIKDLGSSNGTFLNGEALNPGEYYKLCDGDTIHLGNLMLWVNF